ncbi:MAG: DUF4249 domain-containing protein [Bacteroidales bacterium]|nr:DUF4249 domain-containing protein [Bacteroidales bacterium]
MRKAHLIYLAVTGALLGSCTEKIDIDLEDTFVRLVVEGCITTDTMAHEVRLTKTTSYYHNQTPPPVTGARVILDDGVEPSFDLQESPGRPGLYLTPEDYAGVPGRTYRLTIELDEEINGFSTYEASSELRPVAPLDSIRVEYKDRWEAWEVQCYALDPPSVDYYIFFIYKNGILITDTIDEIFAVDDRLYNGNYTNGIGVGYLQAEYEDEFVYPGDTITLRMGNVTYEYLYFLYTVQIESGYKNPLFSGPPANIKGNISNGAIGFFAAYAATYASTIYNPETKDAILRKKVSAAAGQSVR